MNNSIYYGIISEVQADKARVDIGGVITDFLPVFQQASAFKCSWTPIKVKEQCVILAPAGNFNSGYILRGLYSAYIPPNTSDTQEITKYSDGTIVSYDVASGTLAISGAKQITINCEKAVLKASEVTVDSPSIDLGVGGHGVVTQACTCSFTGAPHPMGSATVRAKI